MNDTTVNVVIVLILICHLAALILGYKMEKTTLFISYLNAIVVVGILIFWINKNLNIQEHYFEFREACALCVEACILIFALYSITGYSTNTYVKVINYVGFGLHVLATLGMLIFMSVFKMNKLF
ncbi:hypothetical protein [Cellulophaga baltica]|uniref:hypothetical protein n=1 Tax=Cellulophaga baltica TaxID=76594 RepID=UPI002493D335|nr:hypothetical protein [Cellulophaga baltica]